VELSAASRLLTELKMAVSRFNISSNKKTALMKQQMRDIAKMLSEEPPREEKARIRAEALIREDNCVEAYEILQLECELLAERIALISSTKECPPDLVSCISTLMWAANRVEIQELAMIKKQFRAKYGKTFEECAMNNVGGVVNDRVVSKLSVQPPAAYLVQVYLEKICDQFEVNWKPKAPVTAEQMGEPMAAPVGYSVQVAGASGLGGGLDGLPNKMDYIPPPAPSVAGSSVTGVTGVAAATATPILPTAPGYPAKTQDFEEVDIFVPGAPANDKTDDDDKGDDLPPPPSAPPSAPPAEPPAPPSGGGSSSTTDSFRDLQARFEKLKK